MSSENGLLLGMPSIEYAPSGLIISPVKAVVEYADYDSWCKTLNHLRLIEGATQWWIGDWLNYGEHRWGEKYVQAVNESEAQRWRVYASVAGKYDMLSRNNSLSWSHHLAVAYIEEPRRTELLELAVGDHLSVAELRKLIKEPLQIEAGEQTTERKWRQIKDTLVTGGAIARHPEETWFLLAGDQAIDPDETVRIVLYREDT